MKTVALLVAAAVFCRLCAPSMAVEGSSAAGPIGGTDIRSAKLPPPGIYGGTIQLYAEAHQYFDGAGNLVPALSALDLSRIRAGPFFLAVPGVHILDGSIGFFATAPAGIECGRLFATTPTRFISGFGDPYVEVAWSRYFGKARPSRYPGAFPIAEGLTIALGFGTIIPIGRYDAWDATTQGLTIGNNIWDFAPTAAITFVTAPILAEGTEISAKLYWNNYLENPATRYQIGDLINVDFAISEHIGRFQAGLAGFYAFQIDDDMLHGVRLPPDGRRTEILSLGGVLAYDLPEYGVSLKIKTLSTVIERNTVRSPFGIAVGWIKKF